MSTKDDKIIAEAKDRFKKGVEWEQYARDNWMSDMRFGYGDDINNYQWNDGLYSNRTNAGRPCITVNKTKIYCETVINDGKQNKSQIEIRPVGGGASHKSAEVFEGICRHIEYISGADQAYDQAFHDAVFSGIGYWRVVCDYSSPDSFDQEVFIRRIPDSMGVLLDCDIVNFDGSDAKYGFIFSDKDKKSAIKQWPLLKEISNQAMPLGNYDDDWSRNWQGSDKIRVAEYYRIIEEPDVLHYLPDGTTMRESESSDVESLRAFSLQKRSTVKPRLQWFLIAGSQIVARREDVPGKYVPIVRCVGKEIILNGQLDRMGMVRSLRGGQINFNWFTSGGIEYVAMGTKSPWLASPAAMENFESIYATANQVNHAFIPYNHIDDEGNALPPPTRPDPPVYAPAYLDGRQAALADLETASGVPPVSMGAPSNERSGRAVDARQRNAENVTYHFVDNFATAIKYTGKILIDLIPRVYDTARTVKIMGDGNELHTVQLDPEAPDAHKEVDGLDNESFSPLQCASIFNPNVGTYDVVSEIGPQFTTRREEAVSTLGDIVRENAEITELAGDLLFDAMDVPLADKIATRLRNNLLSKNPAVLGVGPSDQVTQAQTVIQQQHQVIDNLVRELEDARSRAVNSELQKEIDIANLQNEQYKAETDRLKVVGGIDKEALMPIIREMVSSILGQPVNPIIAAHALEAHAIAMQTVTQQQQLQGIQEQ